MNTEIHTNTAQKQDRRMPRRLLFVVHDAPFFVSHRLPIAQAAVARGDRVHVAAPAHTSAAQIICDTGAEFHSIPLNRSSRNPFKETALILFLWQLVGQLQPDILHCVGMKPVLYGGAVARLRSVSGVVHAITGLGFMFLRQDLKTRLARWVIKRMYGFAFGYRNVRVIFQNPDDREIFESAGLLGATPVDMIRGCGVDMIQFAPEAEPSLLRGDHPVVMFPARLIRDKGLAEFIQAVQDLKDDFAHIRFVLVGSIDAVNPTAYRQEDILSWVKEGLIEWWGYSEDMAATLRKADLVVLPSYREGLPRGLIEAAATGLPIIATDVPGCREVVRHGETGLLVPPYDGHAIAMAIRTLLENPEQAAAMGAAGRHMAQKDFSVEHFVTQSLASYNKLEATS